MGSLRRSTERCWQWETAGAGSADASLSPDVTCMLTIAINLSDEEVCFALGAIGACWAVVEKTLTTTRKQRRT
jgi:hypothetical protein